MISGCPHLDTFHWSSDPCRVHRSPVLRCEPKGVVGRFRLHVRWRRSLFGSGVVVALCHDHACGYHSRMGVCWVVDSPGRDQHR